MPQRPGRDTTNETDEIFTTGGGEPAVLDIDLAGGRVPGRHLPRAP